MPLSDRKKTKIALFLGAGASKSLGKPTTVELRNKLRETYAKLGEQNVPANALVHLLADYPEYPDIEYVLQSLKEITDFSKTEGGKFIFDEHFGLHFRTPNWDVPGKTFLANIDKIRQTFEKEVFQNYGWNHSQDPLLTVIYDNIIGLLERRADKLKVFTTNYDKAIEQYCINSEKYECADGFDWSSNKKLNVWQGGNFSYLDGKTDKPIIYLYKLHGSLGWKQHNRGFLVNTGEEGISNDPNYKDNLLIYPTVSPKDGEEKEPYKTIRAQFANFMKEATICIVIGFSFRDQHINAIFEEFLKGGRMLIIVSPSAKKNIHENFLHQDYDEEEEDNTEKPDLEVEDIKLANDATATVRYIREKLSKDAVGDITKMIESVIDRVPK